MSTLSNGALRRRAFPSQYKVGLSALARGPCEPGDELQGGWSREQLTRMDSDFVAAMGRALAAGRETGGVLDYPRREQRRREDEGARMARIRLNVARMGLVG